MKANHKTVIIVGSGIKGLLAALRFSEKGYQVEVVDGSRQVGGILNSPSWDDIIIDLGCHLFFHENDEVTKTILSVIGDDFHPIDIEYASFLSKEKTEGVAIPNFECLDEVQKNKIYSEILIKEKSIDHLNSLSDYYENRFGVTATSEINRCIKKSHLIESSELDLIANRLLPFERIRIFPLEKALSLKFDSWFDDKIAVPRNHNIYEKQKLVNSKYDFREFYPSDKGLKSFGEKLHNKLLDQGVVFHLNTSVENIVYSTSYDLKTNKGHLSSQYLYWAAPQYLIPKVFGLKENLNNYLHNIPVILYYYLVSKDKVSSLTYVHNYDESSYCFRISIQSNYAENNIPKDMALICCEVPAKLESSIWISKDTFVNTIWEEVIAMGLVENVDFVKSKYIQASSAFKLPLKGYTTLFEQIKSKIKSKNLLGINSWDFSKNEILHQINEELNSL